MASLYGAVPTCMGVPGAPVAVSMGVTVFEPEFTTYAVGLSGTAPLAGAACCSARPSTLGSTMAPAVTNVTSTRRIACTAWSRHNPRADLTEIDAALRFRRASEDRDDASLSSTAPLPPNSGQSIHEEVT